MHADEIKKGLICVHLRLSAAQYPCYNPASMQPLIDEICKRCDAGERVALCVVVGSRGSTPQEKGAKMLVLADGTTLGTLGGGCVEAEVRKQAITLLSNNESKLLEFRLDHDYGWDDGLICGGIMDIFVQVIDRDRAAPFQQM